MGTNRLKQLWQGRFFEHAHAQNLKNFVECRFGVQALFGDRYQCIDTDSYPQLGADGVGTGAVKGFDPQVLFEPTEEQLDLPDVAGRAAPPL